MAGCVTGAPHALRALTLSPARGRWLVCTGTTTAVSAVYGSLQVGLVAQVLVEVHVLTTAVT
jgi:hypothetical protein